MDPLGGPWCGHFRLRTRRRISLRERRGHDTSTRPPSCVATHGLSSLQRKLALATSGLAAHSSSGTACHKQHQRPEVVQRTEPQRKSQPSHVGCNARENTHNSAHFLRPQRELLVCCASTQTSWAHVGSKRKQFSSLCAAHFAPVLCRLPHLHGCGAGIPGIGILIYSQYCSVGISSGDGICSRSRDAETSA